MELTVDRKTLNSALQIAASVSPTHTPLDVLKSVRLETGASTQLLGTNSVQSIAVTLECNVESGGCVLLPPAARTIVANCRADEIKIKSTRTGVSLLDGRSNLIRLQTESPHTFPAPPPAMTSAGVTVPGADLQDAIKGASFAAGRAAEQWSVNCIRLEVDQEGLHLVGTDLRRVAHSKVIPRITNAMPECQVPSPAIQVLGKIAGKAEECELRWNGYRFYAQCNQVELSTSLLEGRFPPWRKGFTLVTGTPATLIAADLIPLVSQAAALVDADNLAITVALKRDLLTISTATSQGGIEASMPVDYRGEETHVMVSPQYILEFLRLVPTGDEVSLTVSGPYSIAAFRHGSIEYGIAPISKD